MLARKVVVRWILTTDDLPRVLFMIQPSIQQPLSQFMCHRLSIKLGHRQHYRLVGSRGKVLKTVVLL
eukprot:scaffold140_cov565-Prasinococcus_capsulatus_cf.AAC.13